MNLRKASFSDISGRLGLLGEEDKESGCSVGSLGQLGAVMSGGYVSVLDCVPSTLRTKKLLLSTGVRRMKEVSGVTSEEREKREREERLHTLFGHSPHLFKHTPCAVQRCFLGLRLVLGF